MRIPSYEDVLRSWAARWQRLSCWRHRSLVLDSRLILKPHSGRGRLGYADSYRREYAVFTTGDLMKNMKTILHELAHLDTPGTVHGQPWKTSFAQACCEVTGILVPDTSRVAEMGDSVTEALASWWVSSGNHWALRELIGRRGLVPDAAERYGLAPGRGRD